MFPKTPSHSLDICLRRVTFEVAFTFRFIHLGAAVPSPSFTSCHDRLAEATELKMVKLVLHQMTKDKNQPLLMITHNSIQIPDGICYLGQPSQPLYPACPMN